MTNNISARHIFLFLADQKNWQKEADLNNNGEITKGEMRTYLSGTDFESFCGVKIEDMSAKVFNEFWSTIDANANNNKLDEKELNRVMVQMESINEVKNFVNSKSSDIPSDLSNYSDLWNEELTNALNKEIMNYIKTIGFDKTTLDDTMKGEIEKLLEAAYPEAKKEAAVQCYIQKYTDNNADNAEIKALKEYGYLITDDKDLERIIQQWINQNQDVDFENIGASIKNLVEGYLKTASIGNGNINALEGNSAYDTSKLNELQTAKLKMVAKNSLGASLKDVASNFSLEGINGAIDLTGGGYETTYKKYIDKFLEEFCNSGYKQVTCSNYPSLFDAAVNEIQNNGLNLFKSSQYAKDFETEVIFADNYRFIWGGKEFRDKVVEAGISGDENTAGSDLAKLKQWLNDDCGKTNFPEYYNAYNKILDSILDPYNYDYKLADGSIDFTKISNELLNIVKNKFGINKNNADSDSNTNIDANTSVANAAGNIANVIGEEINHASEYTCGNKNIHCEFAIRNGKIVFQDNSTQNVYNRLVNNAKYVVNEKDPTLISKLGGDETFEKLIQSAWIMTFDESSTSHNTESTITKVLQNLQKILNKLSTNPELISVYTANTSYSDSSVVSGVTHYGTNTTYGNDEKINYEGAIATDRDGSVHIANQTDDIDYQATMNDLLKNLKTKYTALGIDATLIEKVFREAQKKAIEVCQGNIFDCPNGTGNNSGRVEDTNINWGGKDNRKKDGSAIHMDQLVQLTLYQFDKLLYRELIK